ncbi:hypothetical protein [Homoserinibacter sp. GY 40078]|uniref:hypothetical protein n=1 Tax=Homoserinibacter sp. GY 40078 TaxID=2603275 RepID=UPI0011C8E7F3|nr:hypothetical protein [Homoserinibacter sp. GY 40078]TXK19129.1 hypothetical protein FVQ89_04205 [Homoserinibacter sp. GY 40078]
MADEKGLDPRYDPAFQRGYDGHSATRSETARHAPRFGSALQRPAAEHAPDATSAPYASHATRSDVAAGYTAPAAATDAPTAAADAGTGTVPAAPAPEPVVVVAAPAPLRAPWTNPFIIVTAILGLALTAMAGSMLLTASDAMTNPDSYYLAQVSIFGAPPLLAAGLLIVSAVLVICGLHWARRPEPDEG